MATALPPAVPPLAESELMVKFYLDDPSRRANLSSPLSYRTAQRGLVAMVRFKVADQGPQILELGDDRTVVTITDLTIISAGAPSPFALLVGDHREAPYLIFVDPTCRLPPGELIRTCERLAEFKQQLKSGMRPMDALAAIVHDPTWLNNRWLIRAAVLAATAHLAPPGARAQAA